MLKYGIHRKDNVLKSCFLQPTLTTMQWLLFALVSKISIQKNCKTQIFIPIYDLSFATNPVGVPVKHRPNAETRCILSQTKRRARHNGGGSFSPAVFRNFEMDFQTGEKDPCARKRGAGQPWRENKTPPHAARASGPPGPKTREWWVGLEIHVLGKPS
jgi:hypothetical protein